MTPPFLKRKMMLGRAGFSLIELTIMIAIASILFIGVGRAMKSQIVMATRNRDYQIALNLARKQLAIMNLAAIPAVGTTAPASDAAFPGFTYSQVVTSLGTSGTNNLRRIQLDVIRQGAVLVRLYTYRTDLVTFGDGT